MPENNDKPNPDLTNPLVNLMLNMMGGLKFENLSPVEKEILIESGYVPETEEKPENVVEFKLPG